MPFISKTPIPPYYAVVFTSINADVDHTEHTALFKRMVERAEGYQGYLGIEAARNPDGCGLAVVYWKDHESILAFARDPEHRIAKRKGREIWYSPILSASVKLNATTGGPKNDRTAQFAKCRYWPKAEHDGLHRTCPLFGGEADMAFWSAFDPLRTSSPSER